MKSRILYVFAGLCFVSSPAAAQYSNVSPTTTSNVKSAEDFPTRAFQDPWDMSQRTDVGWWTWGTDTAIAAQFVNPSVANGVFTGSMTGAAAALFLLDTPLAPTLPGLTPTPIGKTGQQYPLDTTKYSHLVYRMSSTIGGVSQYVWSTKSYAEDMTLAFENVQKATVVQPGWKIYDVDLSALQTFAALGTTAGWTGTKEALQFIPLAGKPNATIQIDWVRLVGNDNSLKSAINWTGPAADVYLSNSNAPGSATLGRVALNATSGSVTLFVGALPAGTYFIALHSPTPGEIAGSAGGFTYSAGSFVVNDMPTVTFTTPSEEGSSNDFATTKLGDPWDFMQLTDVDTTLRGFPGTVNVVNGQITQIPLTTEAGVNLGNQTVYLATSVAAGPGAANPSDPVGDPQVFTLFWDGKGKTNKIDPTKYRILTVEAGIPNKARSLPTGSIGRVIWRAFNEPVLDATGTKAQTVGDQYAFNSAAGENTDMKFSIDMNKYPVEPHSADVNTTWSSTTAASGGIDGFRFDPHEFSPATNFFLRRIKLAALERTQADQFTIRWTASKAGTVTIFYDQDFVNKSFAGTQACSAAAAAGAGSCTWTVPPALPAGEYQLYATITDSMNTNQVYARTNVIVDHANSTQAVNLDKQELYYAQLGSIHTDPQTIRLTTSGPGTLPCWTATPNAVGFLSISQTTGCGAANISIGVSGFFPAGVTTTLFVTIAPSGSAGDWTPQNISVNVNGLTSAAPPTGSMDTPTDGSTVSGSIAVTGWAADNVEVTAVVICRDPVMGEVMTPSQCAGQPEVFIGNATFIEGARPDIQALFPTTPFNYKAGWGYLLLTNFLPNQGNVTTKLYAWAADLTGHVALLGSKTITADNALAMRPFGAIDTPAQGGVVCGTSFVNFGWALTQSPKDVPADSSTITVFIDGLAVGHPGTRAARSDITAAFPSLNTSHAVGGYIFDSTQYPNGVHTIFWIVQDNAGQSDGIGSRFFTISNPCGG